MNRIKKHLLRNMAAAALLCAGLASCSQDDLADNRQGEPLPPSEYPLMLTASVDGMKTRSAGKDAWTGDEEIGVRIGTDGATGCYKLNADGTVKEVVTPVYWQNTASATITAWYPYKAQTDVNISNQKDGFADFDFLTATEEGADYKSSVTLHFKHQMAKVSYTLQGEGVTNEELKTTAVTLFGDATATFENGVLAPADQPDGEIVSCYDGKTLTGAALLVPQDMTGKPLIKVSINGNNFIYTPTTETAGNLQAGYHTTYNITVKANGIYVTEATGSEWTNGSSSEDVASKTILVKYTADDVKKGDYLYQDGTTSDGGLRAIYTDGTMRSEPVKPQPKNDSSNPVVGIVFWTPSETDYTPGNRQTPASLTDDKIMAISYSTCTHGLAVAVKALIYKKSRPAMAWQPNGSYDHVKVWQAGQALYEPSSDVYVSVSSNTDATDNINRIYGYQNTVVLRAYNAYCLETVGKEKSIVQPVAALDEFVNSNACPAPTKSTGWFLPSVKELHILCYMDVDNVYSQYGTDKTATRNIVNSSLVAVGGDELENIYYWSSSERENSSDLAFHVRFSIASVYYGDKGSTHRSRAVCAF